ncbi:MAG: lamin tail domain-containing protein [Methanothrix sp.]|nr:lamin tail domain-containing protein [Methanothrix sp.]
MRFQSSLILALLCASAIIWLGAAQCSVVINEVEQNPAGDEDAFKTSVTAWFELYNNNDKEVDISGWSINTSLGRSVIFPRGTVIRGIDYYVLDVKPKWLDHSGEVLVLLNATGAEMDRTASLSDEEDNEGAWTRDPDGRDTNSTDDWKFLVSSRGF